MVMAEFENVRGEPSAVEVAPREAYRLALRSYDGAALAALALSLGLTDPPSGRATLAARIADHLEEARSVERAALGLPPEVRLALTLMAVTETHAWPVRALRHALRVLGVAADWVVPALAERGLVAVALEKGSMVRDPSAVFETPEGASATVHAHPAAVASARSVLPVSDDGPIRCEAVVRPRETDGLEPVIRLSAVWQRVVDAPLRQTQQGILYKRDRDRIEDDAVLAGPIADAIEPIPDMASFWLVLAREVGLLESAAGSERITAAPPSYWPDNALHLPRMVSLRWLTLRQWHEQGGMQREGASAELALPYVRPSILLWLATLGEDEWVTIADLSTFLRSLSPHWAAASFLEIPGPGQVAEPAATPPKRIKKGRGKDQDEPTPEEADAATLAAVLLGAAYQFGLVRAGEEAVTSRRAVQITPLGRYVLNLGPPPPPRGVFEHFLFVQPSFEVIAYRQGLTAALVGQFSRFTFWSQVGAALAMRLTPESVYRGLEGGLMPEAMLDLLARHSPRALPAGVSEAVKTWSGRRDRVTYHAAATLVEFASPADLDAALRDWPIGDGPVPVRVSDRIVLVEDEVPIPWPRFRMTGSRNYRLPAEACVEVEPDGVTLTLDLARSDLLVDAELARFADETPPGMGATSAPTRRRFVVSAASLARAEASGLTASSLSPWYERRTGADLPPAVRLLLTARGPNTPPLTTSRPLVLHAPNAELLDGMAQHPETRELLGARLGPTSVVIPDAALDSFRRAVERLGLSFDDSPTAAPPFPIEAKPLAPRPKPR